MGALDRDGIGELTDKEKQTLRLIVRGHDAKSIARSLDLSVHTINERLRDARRKLSVSSSREAARMLLEAEGEGSPSLTPYFLGDEQIGEDGSRPQLDLGTAPIGGVGRQHRRPWIIIGVAFMVIALGLLALAGLSQVTSTPAEPTAMSAATPSSEAAELARRWLALLDEGRWDESYRATGAQFRRLNTIEVWSEASEKARGPLGAVVSRTFLSQERLPAPPNGYEVVKFRTRFANRPDAVETVTLDREDGSWRVVGVTIG